jgi:hypothetical protein
MNEKGAEGKAWDESVRERTDGSVFSAVGRRFGWTGVGLDWMRK